MYLHETEAVAARQTQVLVTVVRVLSRATFDAVFHVLIARFSSCRARFAI